MSARARILASIAAIMAEEGSDHLTVDKIAARAGLSKGGVFYHFKSKEEMVRAMLEALLASFDEDVEILAFEGRSYGEALIEASFAKPSEDGRMVAGILAAASVDRQLGEMFSTHRYACCNRLEAEGIGSADAELLISALDGLYIREALGLGPEPREREALRRRMYRLLCPTEIELLAKTLEMALQSEPEGFAPAGLL